MIRAFVGVKISPDVTDRIFEVKARLERSLEGVRWVHQENFHFTIKFLGAVEEESVASILDVLGQALGALKPFRIVSKGIGVFPDIRRPKVLWVGLEGEDLKSLAVAAERPLEPLGFEKEERDFKPHLTLGRWREFAGPREPLRRELERWKHYNFGESWVREAVLFQSVLKPNGAVYSPLGVLPLREVR